MPAGRSRSPQPLFTDRARLALRVAEALANQDSRAHGTVSPEHLLAALIMQPQCEATIILRIVRPQLISQNVVRESNDNSKEASVLPHSDALSEVLRVSSVEAGANRGGWVGTEHLLLGLVASRALPQLADAEGAGELLANVRGEIERIAALRNAQYRGMAV